MNISLPIAQYHPGNTGEYMAKAFLNLGHNATIIDCDTFYYEINNPDSISSDLYFCVDSGQSIDFTKIKKTSKCKIAMWFIDYRHNKNRQERAPCDQLNAISLLEKNGYIFQAQQEDVIDLSNQCNLKDNLERISWLPVAADPEVWCNKPTTSKVYDIGFIGNLWDQKRVEILRALNESGIKLGFKGHSAVWKESAAELLRECKIGFNVSSFYGTEVAFDLNMRFFETLSCGIPIITNSVPALSRINAQYLPFVRTYNSVSELLFKLHGWISDIDFINSGQKAREWVLNEHTYIHRAKQALLALEESGIK